MFANYGVLKPFKLNHNKCVKLLERHGYLVDFGPCFKIDSNNMHANCRGYSCPTYDDRFRLCCQVMETQWTSGTMPRGD